LPIFEFFPHVPFADPDAFLVAREMRCRSPREGQVFVKDSGENFRLTTSIVLDNVDNEKPKLRNLLNVRCPVESAPETDAEF